VYVPGCVNVKLNVPVEGLIVLDDRVEPVSLVTVCGASETLVHVTFVPLATVIMVGLNPYLSLCSVIFTWAEPVEDADVAALVALALGAVVAVGAGAVVGLVALVPPVAVVEPHPARSSMASSTMPGHHWMHSLRTPARCARSFIVISPSQPCSGQPSNERVRKCAL
jgi:hypothetical protein